MFFRKAGQRGIMSLSRRADPIRLIAARLGQGELKQLTNEPEISEAFRVSVHYHETDGLNSVATLRRGHGDNCKLQVVYDKAPKAVKFEFEVPIDTYRELMKAIRQAKFDTLDDEEDVPYLGVDMWLVERVAGSFYHDIVLCPTSARGHHRELMLAIKELLPQSVRKGAG